MIADRSGCHRTALLVGRYVVKVPVVGYGLRWWVRGWLVNLNEAAEWRATRDSRRCPVLLSFFGLVIVMPRCQTSPPVSHEEVIEARDEFEARRGYVSNAEPYAKSYGRMGGRVVEFDYGSVR